LVKHKIWVFLPFSRWLSVVQPLSLFEDAALALKIVSWDKKKINHSRESDLTTKYF